MMQAIGSHFGPYEIVAPLGSGGMGEVFRARDPRLQRDVAIKVLPAGSSRDAAARERFQREARAVAALNHPHICAVYDVGVQGSADYLVMELIEGQTLAARLMSGGSMTIDATLTCAIQVADALDTAHRAGIVHRDLKAGNVMLTKSGAKLLDFGLAKRVASEPGSQDVADQEGTPATATVGPTEQGQVMGTWPYMAPEQILGRAVDARTDVFAFGVMLYEMLAGRRPFGGSSGHAVMAAILERTPEPVAKAAPALPPSIDRVLQKCLAKDPHARWQTMRDLADQLRWIRDDLEHEEVSAPRRAQTWRIALPLALIVGAVGAAAGLLLAPGPDAAPQAVVRFAIDAADFDTSGSSAPEISPDGRQVVFVGRPKAGGPARLLLHDLASGLTRPLEATDGASLPFWSADGRSVAYVAGGELKRLDLPHGSPRTIARVQGVFLGAAWNRDGVMLVSYRYGLYRMPADGGTQVQVTALDRSRYENSHRWPQFLPDGQRFVYVARSGRPDQSSAYLGYLDGRSSVRLSGAVAQVRYAASYLFFVRGTTLMAQSLDPDAPALRGDPIPLADGLNKNATGLRARFSVSATGALAYQTFENPKVRLVWYDRGARPVGTVGEPAEVNNFRLSPGGQTVAVDIDDPGRGGRSLWLMDGRTGSVTRMTFGEFDEWIPIWSRDGSRIMFGSYRNGPLDLVQKPASGASADTVVLAGETQKSPSDWSRDGRTVLVGEGTAERLQDVVAFTLESGARTAIAQSVASEQDARFSPDDRWVAYSSDESGRMEVYVQPFPPTGAKWQVSTTGGSEPAWREDGRELYYMDLQRRIVAVPVETGTVFRRSTPVVLFPTEAAAGNGFEPAPDGRRFLVRELAAPPNPALPMHVILNWPALVSVPPSRPRSSP